jgi:multimeric flavodoxin WrbA
MKITVINGTEQKGCTFHLKECFLSPLREENEITEFYLPGDFPHFCHGCKTCFMQSEDSCPHAEHTMKIWDSLREADLLVIAFPIYVSGIPGQLKALLDHFACHHMVHKPDKDMFGKRAVILSQSLRSSNRVAKKEVENSLTWLGVSDIKSIGFALKDSYVWDELSQKHRKTIETSLQNLALKYRTNKSVKKGVKVMLLFALSKMMIQNSLKNSGSPTTDAEYWRSHGWIS